MKIEGKSAEQRKGFRGREVGEKGETLQNDIGQIIVICVHVQICKNKSHH